MRYSRSLRTIGQSLETLRVEDFELEKEDDAYVVRSKSLTPTSQWIVRNSLIDNTWDFSDPEQRSTRSVAGDGWLRYDPLDISRLDVQGRKKGAVILPRRYAEPVSFRNSCAPWVNTLIE